MTAIKAHDDCNCAGCEIEPAVDDDADALFDCD